MFFILSYMEKHWATDKFGNSLNGFEMNRVRMRVMLSTLRVQSSRLSYTI